MTNKRFKNSSIISGTKTKDSNRPAEPKKNISFFSLPSKKQLFVAPTDQDGLVQEIQSLQVSKKKLKEEIEDLRKLKRKENKQAKKKEKASSKERLPQSLLLKGGAGVAVLALIITFLVMPRSESLQMTPMVQAGLDAFSDAEKGELAQVYREQRDRFDREYAAIEEKVAQNTLIEEQADPVLMQGLEVLKNQVFIEYQSQLGIMELQQLLFEKNAPEVAEGLEQGISQIKSEIIAQLKTSIDGGAESNAQESIAQLANILFLKSQKNAIKIMEISSKIYTNQ